jgi:hypothetical protein
MEVLDVEGVNRKLCLPLLKKQSMKIHRYETNQKKSSRTFLFMILFCPRISLEDYFMKN